MGNPIDEIYEKAKRDAAYRKQLNKELEFLGMPWLKAPEPDDTLHTEAPSDPRPSSAHQTTGGNYVPGTSPYVPKAGGER